MTHQFRIAPLLIDRRGQIQSLKSVPVAPYLLAPMQARGFAEGPYYPTDLEKDDPHKKERMKIYIESGVTRFPKVDRTLTALTRNDPTHHPMIDLLDEFDARAEQVIEKGEPIFLRVAR